MTSAAVVLLILHEQGKLMTVFCARERHLCLQGPCLQGRGVVCGDR